MANITHKLTLSTTEPNNDIGLLKVRHADEETQVLDVTITENGVIKSFTGLVPFFCLMAREITGQGVSEEKIDTYSASAGKLQYTMSANAYQMLGKNEAYFSFRKQSGDAWTEQFSTRSFYYVVEKSVYSQPFKDSNYFWTFKELYEKFIRYQNQGKTSWEDFVNQNKEILENVDPGGVILSELIEARDGEKKINDRLERDLNNFEIQLNNPLRKAFVSIVEVMKEKAEKIDNTHFSLGFFTDAHYSEMTGVPHFSTQKYSLSHLDNFNQSLKNADALVYGGDNIASENPDLNVNLAALNTFSAKIFDDVSITADRFMLKGNHDEYAPVKIVNETSLFSDKKTTLDYYLSKDIESGYYRTDRNRFGEIRNEKSLYFYKDYPNKKVRLIGLNSNDTPRTIGTDGYLKYIPIDNLGFQNDQINWLANVALKNVPTDYDVVIVSHAPLTDTYTTNADIVRGVLKAFQSGSSYTGVGSVDDWKAGVTVDYSTQGPKKIVGCFAGHWHKEQFSGLDDELHVISLDSSWYASHANRSLATDNDTNGEDCWYLLDIDTTNKKVIINGFDAGNNYEFNY